MKFGFYSTMTGMPWGGSEVLWSEVAHRLLANGHEVAISYRRWVQEPVEIKNLREAGASVSLRRIPPPLSFNDWFFPSRWPQKDAVHIKRWLDKEHVDFALVTLGYHMSAVAPSSDLRRREIPYAINVQCANADFLDSVFLDEFRDAYAGAARVYFVSDDNLKRVEVNLAMALDNAQIIGNPFNVSFDAAPQWPHETDGYRLACVARIHFPSKGQDLIIDVMRQDKWRARNLTVHLYGQSHGNLRQAEDLIAKHGLQEKIYIEGYAQDIEELWSRHHGLLLPSRCEGAALAILEALLCSRVCITTAVGRNEEFISDGETGFIAPAATIELIDQAMEAAWQKRGQWHQMGKCAGENIRDGYSRDPVEDFYRNLLSVATQHGKDRK